MRINIAIPKNVAPRGFPICRSLVAFVGCGFMPSRSDSVAFSRNSWVIAIPMEAKAKEVRSQARKVRSYTTLICQRPQRFREAIEVGMYQEQDDLSPHFLYYPALCFRIYPQNHATILPARCLCPPHSASKTAYWHAFLKQGVCLLRHLLLHFHPLSLLWYRSISGLPFPSQKMAWSHLLSFRPDAVRGLEDDHAIRIWARPTW